MLITPQYVTIKWNKNNKRNYMNKGYKFTKYDDEIAVNVEDLAKGNRTIKIKVLCDYCDEVYFTTYSNYNVSISKINKACCSNTKCMGKKREEMTLLKYGVKNVAQLEEVKEKVKHSNLERFGVECTLQSQEVRNRAKETLLLKYGVENYTQTEEYLEKLKETSLRKYGVDNPNKSEIVQNKKNKTMYKNGTTKSSRQQRYLHKLFGGELNYPVNKSILDIAYVDKKIYIEYDGSGHDLRVKKDNVTQLEFETKERKRYFALKKQGWKSIRIISKYDKLPNDDVLYDMLNTGLESLNKGFNWVNFLVDENVLETVEYRKFYDYGEIKKLKH